MLPLNKSRYINFFLIFNMQIYIIEEWGENIEDFNGTIFGRIEFR